MASGRQDSHARMVQTDRPQTVSAGTRQPDLACPPAPTTGNQKKPAYVVPWIRAARRSQFTDRSLKLTGTPVDGWCAGYPAGHSGTGT